MTLALLCQFTAQHVSDVNTAIFRSLRLLGALLCRLTWGVLVLCSSACIRYHITNSQPRYITPTRLMSAQYSLHNNAPSSRKLLKMDVLTSETCWAVNWHKSKCHQGGLPLFKYQDDARSNTHRKWFLSARPYMSHLTYWSLHITVLLVKQKMLHLECFPSDHLQCKWYYYTIYPLTFMHHASYI